jgi:hypothetical protein
LIESINNDIKRISPSTTTPDEAVRTRFSQILSYLAGKPDIHTAPFIRNALQDQLHYITSHHLPAEVLERARILINVPAPVQFLEVNGVWYFNRKGYIDEPVTSERVQQYIHLLAGGGGSQATEPVTWHVYKSWMSLHAVRISLDNNGRAVFVCDCKLFHHSGYLCSHSLAARHLHSEHTLDVHRMAQELPANKKVGRKRKNTGALTVEDNTVGLKKIKVVNLNDMTPIVKPMALIGAPVLDVAAGFFGTIRGYSKDTDRYTVSNPTTSMEWSEAEVRQGLAAFKKCV